MTSTDQTSDNDPKLHFFESLAQKMDSARGGIIEFACRWSKVDFLEFMVRRHSIILHGSNLWLEHLEPRPANCASHAFGSNNGVYAVSDPILPMFYAIKNRRREAGPLFQGRARSGFRTLRSGQRAYNFQVSREMVNLRPWTRGFVYLLTRDGFIEDVDENGVGVGEWLSLAPVQAIGALEVCPDDFPFMNQVKALDECDAPQP